MLERVFNELWYGRFKWLGPVLFWPLSLLYWLITSTRKWLYRRGLIVQFEHPTPVVVVGNITTGGAGKTPLTQTLATSLKGKGVKVAIISRGYGGQAENYPCEVHAISDAQEVGDEPLLLKLRLGCPVVVDRIRSRAATYVIEKYAPDVILCDDGLQHLPLGRDFEIAVIDSQRSLGNRWLLPSGPLREMASRLNNIDAIVYNGENDAKQNPNAYTMQLEPEPIRPVRDLSAAGNGQSIPSLPPQKVHAVAGIANPQRFFDTLRGLGYEVIEHPLPDHYHYTLNDLQLAPELPIIMTEKDAVKCRNWVLDNVWYMPVSGLLNKPLDSQIIERLNLIKAQQHG